MIDFLPEDPALHADAIEDLYDRTFGPGHFAKTAERLRDGNHSLPECSRVAVRDGEVIGACRIWPVAIGHARESGIFVGPLAVAPEWQGRRLGQELTRDALGAAKAAGWRLAIIIGSPDYFLPVGFTHVPPGQLTFPGPQDMNRVMYLVLADDAILPEGPVTLPPDAALSF